MRSLTNLFLLATFGLFGLTSSASAQHFTGCISNGDNNATFVIPDTVSVDFGSESGLEANDEIALFTNDGECAGSVTWDGTTNSIAVAGEDADLLTDALEGYASNETFKMRIWDASEGMEYTAEGSDIILEDCSSAFVCDDDGAYTSNGFSTVQEINATALPVELTSFEARLDQNEAVLEWKTASEVNNAGFEIEHQAPRAANWAKVSFVEGHGTTSEAKSYRFKTDELKPGPHKFRLKQVDYDGAFEYSSVVEMEVTLSTKFNFTPTYPNPFHNRTRFSLTLRNDQEVRIAVYNTIGQRVASIHNGPLAANEQHEFSVDGSRLPSGIYFIRAQGDSFSETRRAVLVR